MLQCFIPGKVKCTGDVVATAAVIPHLAGGHLSWFTLEFTGEFGAGEYLVPCPVLDRPREPAPIPATRRNIPASFL
jgi:hypothetical protein